MVKKHSKKVRKPKTKDPKIVINITNNKPKTRKRKAITNKYKAKGTGIIHVNDKYNPVANTMYMGNPGGIPTSNKPVYDLTPYINKIPNPASIPAVLPVAPSPIVVPKIKYVPMKPRFQTGHSGFDKLSLKDMKDKAKELVIKTGKLKTKEHYFNAFAKHYTKGTKEKHTPDEPIIEEPVITPEKKIISTSEKKLHLQQAKAKALTYSKKKYGEHIGNDDSSDEMPKAVVNKRGQKIIRPPHTAFEMANFLTSPAMDQIRNEENERNKMMNEEFYSTQKRSPETDAMHHY
jgi:hypothetical protein